MDVKEIFGHVQDGTAFHLPQHVTVNLPMIGSFQITKFMVLELIAALLMCLLFIPLARRIRNGEAPKGCLWNLLEALLVFLRDRVARPSIGHDADRFMPFIWTIFFFVLFCNLLGILPWCGSPTGAMATTATLALMTFGAVLFAGMTKHGVVGFWTGMVPHMDVPGAMGFFLKPMLFVIEVIGLFIKHSVLAVRLLANMFAGHLVLAVIVAFIGATAGSYFIIWFGVTVGSVVGAVALNGLELFVAFLQAYIFAFLSALFIGMAIHQH